MPIYEYICQECKKRFEKIVSCTQKTIDITCPFCHSNNVKKTISAPNIKCGDSTSSCNSCNLNSCSCCDQ